MGKTKKIKNNRWENLAGFRYAHRGLFHEPRSASRRVPPHPGLIPVRPRWIDDIREWKVQGKKIVPENSMEAFRKAVKHGFGSELDVHLTRDGRLAVFHDDNLFRMTGEDMIIEETTYERLKEIPLLDTAARIPLLEEVLDLYTSEAALTDREDQRGEGRGKLHLPLIIELKPEGNTAMLCSRVMEVIDRYPTLNYCVESFDPRAVYWLGKHRPDVIRGQLTENFMKSRDAVKKWGYVCTFGMWSVAPNLLSKPDFIASKFQDRRNYFIRLSHRLGVHQVNWTIRSMKDLRTVDREGGIGIFERFLPDSTIKEH